MASDLGDIDHLAPHLGDVRAAVHEAAKGVTERFDRAYWVQCARSGRFPDEMWQAMVDQGLLDARGFPLLVLEAKAEHKNPLVGKEQARKYARSQNCRFVILSNGNLHYFWDLERGNPYLITTFPTPGSVAGCQKTVPSPSHLIAETVGDDYIVISSSRHDDIGSIS